MGIRIGMLTPSSNTVLEPLTAAILAGTPSVTTHFARLRVTEITTEPGALAQFDLEPMLVAAGMLADARPHAVIWNGTSGGWRGLDADRGVVAALQERCGVAASTVTLALVDLLKAQQIERIGFITPYTETVQRQILGTFAAEGFACTASPCLGISENFAFGMVGQQAMDEMAERAAAAAPQVIIPFCTNLAAAPHAERWERQLGIPVFDSVAIAARAGLKLSGVSPKTIRGWGSVFAL